MPTYGERLVTELLKLLPKSQYFWIAEPTIATKSAYRNPDFVIVSSRLGVIVLEVKDWVEITHASLQNIQIKRRDNTTSLEINPVKIAREYAMNLARRFEQREELLHLHRGKRKLKFPWMYAIALPNIRQNTIDQLEQAGVWEKGVVFGKEVLISDHFERSLNHLPWTWHLSEPIRNDTLDIIRGVVDPYVVVINTSGNDIGTLTINQEKIIREPIKPQIQHSLPIEVLEKDTENLAENISVRLVRGVAGSGKSLVLARRAQYLADLYPNQRILVLAFNKDLVADLKRRIRDVSNLEVTNFHKICSRIMGAGWKSPLEVETWLQSQFSNLITEYGFNTEFIANEIEWRKELKLYNNHAYLEVPREGRRHALNRTKRGVVNIIFEQYIQHQSQNNVIDWSDVPFKTLDALSQSHPLFQAYDVILIDEAQDFAPSWITVVKQLLKPDGILFMCDDPTQSLFRSFSWKHKGVEVVGRTRILRVPFRCTLEITQAAYSLIGADNVLSNSEEITSPDLTTYKLLSGEKPTLFRCTDLQQEIQFTEQTALNIEESGIASNSIAILCHTRRIVKHWAHLRSKGFYVESFSKMKGLEFQAVLLPHLHTLFDQNDNVKDEVYISETRRRIFTAMTRAREFLIMSYQNVLPSELNPMEEYIQREGASS